MEEAFLMSIMSSVRPSVYKIKRRNVYIGLLKSVTVLKISGGNACGQTLKNLQKEA